MNALLLHGWGLKRTIWDEAAFSFSCFDKLWAPCLYETARQAGCYDINSISNRLNQSIETESIVIAWSLGSLIAMSLQKLSDKVKAIVFIASSPCFVNKTGWTNVIDKKNICSLQTGLKDQPIKTLEYFSGLIAHGDIKAKVSNKIIRKHLANEKDAGILSIWLDEMQSIDNRNYFSKLKCPALILLGENDSLVKAGIKQDLHSLNKNCDIQIIKNCGHAPFLTEQQETSYFISEFINAKFNR